MRCSVNRLLQLAQKPRLQSMRSDTSSHVWPSASSKISRARRESSARSVRLLARRVSSISSEFDNVMASLMDAIIVYKWSLQSTSRYPEGPEGLLSLAPQLVCYSSITVISEVVLVVFVRKHAPEIQYLKASISEEQRQEFGRVVDIAVNQIEAGALSCV